MSNEREFIHDILNPLSIAFDRSNRLCKKLEEAGEPADSKTMVQLTKIRDAVTRTVDLIQARRNELKKSDGS